ncbi:MAG: DUF488 domain-containing protein [Bacteroidetes bacterium]|nr:DUF488 domain-containing protein [Bacteroidota bacterium]
MYYRRRLLLSLLQAVGGRVEKMRLHKLLQLGIPSDERQELHSQADRDALFRHYAARTLPNTREAQEHLAALVATEGRVAIMCFEHEQHCCHRGTLAQAVLRLPDFKGQLIHL